MKISTTTKAMKRAYDANPPPILGVLGWVEADGLEGALVRNATGLIHGWEEGGRMFPLDQSEVHLRLRQSQAGKRPKQFSDEEIERRRALMKRVRQPRMKKVIS